jgi:hypothetical protein
MPGITPSTTNGVAAARFSLTIDGVEIAQFSELLRIVSEIEPFRPEQGESKIEIGALEAGSNEVLWKR